MISLFAKLRERSTLAKALLLFGYGVITFLAIYAIGNQLLGNPLFFRVFEFLWFAHILIICNQLRHGQGEFLLLAIVALSPGIINNLLGLLELQQ
jgi:hypothetical protein